jgi:hypothetical protein
MKPLPVVICVFVVGILTISTCGCTSLTGSVAPPPDNLADAIDDFYKERNFSYAAFLVDKEGDTVTYTGTVTDPPDLAERYITEVRVILTTNDTSAKNAYDSEVKYIQAKQQNSSAYRSGIHRTPPKETSGLVLYGATTDHLDYLTKADMTEYTQVLSYFSRPFST